MHRTIVQPPEIGAAALAELRHWLAISRTGEDELLADLLETSVTMCEAFTGQSVLLQTVEETIPPGSGWQEFTSRPVRELIGADIIAKDGSRTPLSDLDRQIEFRASGSACVRLLRPVEGRGVALRLIVGVADVWDQVPAPLRQGVIRLAAHHYRQRDTSGPSAAPASVTALWRPWRHPRLG